MRDFFDMLNDAYGKFYSPSEHLAVDEVLCCSKGELFSSNTFLRNINTLV
jgi:hypothetical protein